MRDSFKKIALYIIACTISYSSCFCVEEVSGGVEKAYLHSILDDLTLRVAYRGKKGLGYRYGYGTLGLFYCPKTYCLDIQPLVDVRLHRIDNGHFASNIGVGCRKRFCDQIGGVNAFYDYREEWDASFHQIGIGGEWFTSCFDIRANGYFPVGKSVQRSSCHFFYPGGYQASKFIRKYAFFFAEIEAGKCWNLFCNLDVYTAAGPYYFKSRFKGNACGAKWRARTTFWNALTVEVLGTYDRIFSNRIQCYIGIDIPIKNIFCNLSKIFCGTWKCGCNEMCAPIYRNELIVLKRSCNWRANY